MKEVACEDTRVSDKEKRMSHREALLYEHHARLAAAVNALDELHDDCDIDDLMYGLSLRELHRVMRRIERIIAEEQRIMAELWPEPNVDGLVLPIGNGSIEITRLQYTP